MDSTASTFALCRRTRRLLRPNGIPADFLNAGARHTMRPRNPRNNSQGLFLQPSWRHERNHVCTSRTCTPAPDGTESDTVSHAQLSVPLRNDLTKKNNACDMQLSQIPVFLSGLHTRVSQGTTCQRSRNRVCGYRVLLHHRKRTWRIEDQGMKDYETPQPSDSQALRW